MTKQQKNILIGIAIVLLGYSVFYFFHSRVVPEQTSVLPVSEVKTYSNATYGISFSYPKKYILDEYDPGDAHRYHHSIVLSEDNETNRAIREGKLMETEGQPSITIDIYQNNLDKQSVREWVEGSSNSNFKLGDGTYEEVTLAGTPAFHYFWDGLYRGESIVFAHKDNIIMLSVTYLEPTDPIRADFSQVVGSFKL